MPEENTSNNSEDSIPIEPNQPKNNSNLSIRPQVVEDGRYCWVCFATDEDDELALWVQPCKCRGTTKWVHQSCLQRWVDEKQKGNTFSRVSCPQCQTEYLILFPKMGKFVCFLEAIDSVIKKLSPFLAAGVIVGSIYWTAVTYGAITILQVVGHKEGLELMEKTDPLILLIGLPAIPVGLVLGRMFRWEDMILRFIQNKRSAARKFPLLSLILPVAEDEEQIHQSPNTPVLSDPISATRVLCGALLLPTISTIVGRLFFDSVQNNLHRALLGGLTFVVVKGVLKIYHKQQKFLRKQDRKILDYTDENVKKYGNVKDVIKHQIRQQNVAVGGIIGEGGDVIVGNIARPNSPAVAQGAGGGSANVFNLY